jgi:hypothetical protein
VPAITESWAPRAPSGRVRGWPLACLVRSMQTTVRSHGDGTLDRPRKTLAPHLASRLRPWLAVIPSVGVWLSGDHMRMVAAAHDTFEYATRPHAPNLVSGATPP